MTEFQLEELQRQCATYSASRGYKLGGRLGFGGSAAVFCAETSSGDVAIKVYLPEFLSGKGGTAERRRIELQRQLIGHTCSSLVQLRYVSFEQETCFIEMDYFPWKDLARVLIDVPRDAIYPLMGQLIEAVRFLESKTLVHRDIKPANILISPEFDKLVLIDLGVVREATVDEDRADNTDYGDARPFIATAQYSSPEYLFRTLPPSPGLWTALTVYQVGGVLHDLIVRSPMFEEEAKTGNRYAVALAVQQKTPNFDGIKDVPIELRTLALHCLIKDPNKRLKLVDWERFSTPATDIKGVQKRLAALGVVKTKQHAEQQELQKRELERKDVSRSLFESVYRLIRENFSDSPIEDRSTNNDWSRSILRLHFPATDQATDFYIAVHWPPAIDGAGGSAGITVQGALVHKTSEPQFRVGRVVTVMEPDSTNFEVHAQSVFEVVANLLVRAVEILEQGEPTQVELQLGD
nr:protein kinase [Hylemonella gracilis]